MRLDELEIPGAFVIELERHVDERGSFSRVFEADTFRAHGLRGDVSECSVSWNRARGTLRGMHYQIAPHAECKLVLCTRGAVFDVTVDLRPGSPTFCRWVGVELAADAPTRRAIYVPEGVAHGFVTLEDKSEVYYQIAGAYAPECARGVRWDDPRFAIDWPVEPTTFSERDAAFADFAP